MQDAMRVALEKIADTAYDKAIFKNTCDTRVLWDIYWLARAGLGGNEPASLLEAVEKMSGVSTDCPERRLEDCDNSSSHTRQAL